MKISPKDLTLYAVTDRTWLEGRSLCSQVEEAIKGGVTFVQLREKELDEEAFAREALELKELCARYGVPFVINDNVRLAAAVDADGVHVGQGDMAAVQARAILGPDKIIGVSCKTVEQALAAQADGADYLGVGAIFPTGTKTDATCTGLETLEQVCRAVDIPVVAIGGIGASNLEQLAGSGMAGIAVVSAIFAQQDSCLAARQLREKLAEIL